MREFSDEFSWPPTNRATERAARRKELLFAQERKRRSGPAFLHAQRCSRRSRARRAAHWPTIEGSGVRHDRRSPTRRSIRPIMTARPITSAAPDARPSSSPIRIKYLKPETAKAEPVPAGTIYTCPMHPEIRQVGPGSCPICGMALEPELVTAEAAAQRRTRGHDAATVDRRRARHSRFHPRDGQPSLQSASHHQPDRVELAAARARDARRALGGISVLRARLEIARKRAISTCSR